MSKLLTPPDLSRALADDRLWRIREISDLKSAVRRADSIARRALLRSMLALCYAHWEGSIRYAAKTYLDYIAIKKIRYRDLNPQFTKNIFINRIGNYYQSRPPFQERCSLVEDVLGSGESRFSKADHEIVNTRSNLNSLVLSDICLVCGIDRSIFTEKDHFIDVFLLKRRNEIAHGEGTFIDLDDLDELAEGTIELIRMFGDALENIIYTDAYRKIEPVL